MIKCKDFVPEIIKKGGFFTVAKAQEFQACLDQANEWISNHQIEVINIETVVIRFGTDHFIFYLHWNTARTCAARTAPVPAAYPILNVEYPDSRSSSIQSTPKPGPCCSTAPTGMRYPPARKVTTVRATPAPPSQRRPRVRRKLKTPKPKEAYMAVASSTRGELVARTPALGSTPLDRGLHAAGPSFERPPRRRNQHDHLLLSKKAGVVYWLPVVFC